MGAAVKLIDLRRIWDQAPHNAFPDLIRFAGRWLCVLREGASHVSGDGALRVIASADGARWETAAHIRSPDSDLREARFSVAPNGRLIAGVRLHDGGIRTTLCRIDPETAGLTELLALHDGLLWVSYYSSHEGKTAIYLATVRTED